MTIKRVPQQMLRLSVQTRHPSVAAAMPSAEALIRLVGGERVPDDCNVLMPDEELEAGATVMLIWQDVAPGLFERMQALLGSGWRALNSGGLPVRDVIVKPAQANCGSFALPGVAWAMLSQSQVERIVFEP